MLEIDAYHLNWKTVQTVNLAMTFDVSFDCKRFFLLYLLPKIVKKQISLSFVHFYKLFYPVAQTIKMNWASWFSLDCLEKHPRAWYVQS